MTSNIQEINSSLAIILLETSTVENNVISTTIMKNNIITILQPFQSNIQFPSPIFTFTTRRGGRRGGG
jgi:hypothetical protein